MINGGYAETPDSWIERTDEDRGYEPSHERTMLQDDGKREYMCGPENCGYDGDKHCQNCGFSTDEL